MIDTREQLQAVLATTVLGRSRLGQIRVPGSGESVFVLEAPEGSDTLQMWQAARALLPQTGRWPVLHFSGGDGRYDWDAPDSDGYAEDLFSRYYYEEEERDGRAGDAPADVLAAAGKVDLAAARQAIGPDDSVTLDDLMDMAVEETQGTWGQAPSASEQQALLKTLAPDDQEGVERWMLEWELTHCPEPLALPEHGQSHMDWFEPDPAYEQQVLLLMPVAQGHQVPAYIHWYGATRRNSQWAVALLERWQERHGAELVAHYGTMLHFVVQRPPEDIGAAFELACEHQLAAPCTTLLPGVSLRNHARALRMANRWFLHERP